MEDKFMFNDFDDLLTIEELCSILTIGKNVAYSLLNTKQIKAFRIGRSWRIPKRSEQKINPAEIQHSARSTSIHTGKAIYYDSVILQGQT